MTMTCHKPLLLCVVFVFVFSVCVDAKKKKSNFYPNVTAKSLASLTKKNDLVLLVFSASWCKHCQHFEKEYEKVQEAVLEREGWVFGRVDVAKEKAMSEEFNLDQLPVAYLVKKSKKFEYKGTHDAASFLAYMEKQMADPLSRPTSVDAVESFVKSEDGFAVVALVEKKWDQEVEDYTEAAADCRPMHSVRFALVTDPTVTKHFGKAWNVKLPAYVFLRVDDGVINDKQALLATEFDGDLSDWVRERCVRLVDELTPANFNAYESLRLPILVLFLNPNTTEENKNLLREYKLAAAYFVGTISFVHMDGVKYASKKTMLGVPEDVVPALAVNSLLDTHYVFDYDMPLNAGNIKAFADDFLAGKKREVKKPAPKSNTFRNSVVKITSKNFNDVVLDEDKDVLLLLCSQAVESCRNFEIYYNKVADRFIELGDEIGLKTVVVGQMDVDQDPPPRLIQIQALPSVVIFPAKEKEPPLRYYNGEGKVTPLMKWVEEHASFKFTLPDLPHLNPQQVIAYHEQMAEREAKMKEQEELAKSQEKLAERARAKKEAEEAKSEL